MPIVLHASDDPYRNAAPRRRVDFLHQGDERRVGNGRIYLDGAIGPADNSGELIGSVRA